MNNQESALSRKLLSLDLEDIASSCGWRSRSDGRISPLSWCLSFLQASCVAQASLGCIGFLSGSLSRLVVSKQAIHKRLRGKGVELILAALERALKSRCSAGAGSSLLGYGRIVLQDSTSIALPKAMAKHYRGSGNHTGKKSTMKLQAYFDLVSGRFLRFQTSDYVRTDQACSADAAEVAGSGDLLVRDLGYFSLKAFRSLSSKGIHLLSRLRSDTVVRDALSGERLDLLAELEGRESYERDVLVGARGDLGMRAIAFALPKREADRRRRKLRKKAKANGYAPKKATLALQGWQIYLTNCPKERLSAAQARELYAQRWTIEILFKAFKSHARVADIPKSASIELIHALVYSALLRVVLLYNVVPDLIRKANAQAKVSVLKLATLIDAIALDRLEELEQDPTMVENLIRHSCYEKRKRPNQVQKLEAIG